MIWMIFSLILSLGLILYVAKRGNLQEKMFGLVYLFISLNALIFYFASETHRMKVLGFMNIANILFLLFVYLIIKYISSGEH
ncbi:TPA: hypothetical protein DCW38_00940 [candidate division WOR-3 bacterium]|jgi:hypothetical protein|uniref:Uncharacterized protein n=1 Tax=candidate division WOR-3 bacterium TaxID=2052148 RepID=A0A350H870_UNCW3|nr:hypothetical protein [candidate division WOR-3 bacterium]